MKKGYLAAAFAVCIILLSSCGSNPGQTETSNVPAAPSKPTGDVIYKRSCVSCHQSNGEGLPNVYPPLAKSDFITDKEKTIGQVIKGYTGEMVVNGKKYNSTMPAQQLNDDEVAAVLTYVYSNFGNGGTSVTAGEVTAARAKLQ